MQAKLTLFILLCGFHYTANAENQTKQPFYIGTSVGLTHSSTHSNDLYIQPNWCNNGSNYQCSTDKNDSTWQVKAGYQVTPHWAIEGSYTDLGNTLASSITKPTLPNFNAQLRQQTQAWTVAAVGKTPIAHNDKWQAYGKVGMSRWASKATYRNDAAYTGNIEDKRHGIDPMIGLGLEYRANAHWSGTVGIDHYFNQGERKPLLNWATPQTLRTQKTDNTAVLLGVAYHF